MKKIKLLTTTLCLLLAAVICASCRVDPAGETDGVSATQGAENTASVSAEDKNADVQSGDKRVLYYDTTDNFVSFPDGFGNSNEISLQPVDSRFEISGAKIKKDSKLSDKNTITIGHTSYTFDYRQSYDNAFLGRNYNEYVKMIGKVRDALIRLSEKDGSIVFFYKQINEETGTVTEDEAREKADALLLELYGKEAQTKYQFYKASPDSMGLPYYHFDYMVRAWGYPTSDTITITYDTFGNCAGIRTPMFEGAYNAEQQFTKADVEAAKAAIENSVSSTCDCTFIQIILDTDGKYYVEYGIFYPSVDGVEYEGVKLYAEIIPSSQG